MPIDPKQSPAREALLDDISEELLNLEGAELEQFLIQVGLSLTALLDQHDKALATALSAQGKRRLEAARAQLKVRPKPDASSIVVFDIARKRALFDAIRARTEQSGEMTIAARNQKIESEEDLDSFLEACLRLGLINANGEFED